jgi:hypothetical protein
MGCRASLSVWTVLFVRAIGLIPISQEVSIETAMKPVQNAPTKISPQNLRQASVEVTRFITS